MKEINVTFALTDEQQRELEHITALFNAVYAGQTEPRNAAQMFETIARDGIQTCLETWRYILEAKASPQEGGQHEPDT